MCMYRIFSSMTYNRHTSRTEAYWGGQATRPTGSLAVDWGVAARRLDSNFDPYKPWRQQYPENQIIIAGDFNVDL